MDDFDRFLQEDLNKIGDVTSNALFTTEKGRGNIVAKEPCVVAGIQEAEHLFQKLGLTVKKKVNDGEEIKKNALVLEVTGLVKEILKGERLALNIIGRMSGIATQTKTLVSLCRQRNSHIQILATRKTTPGFRAYEKKAVVLGGGFTHRMGLYDAIMIKDNHLNCVSSLQEAIEKVLQSNIRPIEIEVEHEDDAIIAAGYPIDVIMLDNFSPQNALNTAEKIRRINTSILIEVSGGITPDNILEYVPFADRISLGYLTHTVINKDFSLSLSLE